MNWPWARQRATPLPNRVRAQVLEPMAHPLAAAEDEPGDAPEPFRCTTCGRTDLPETGGWDPPICQECDAAINFDAEVGR
jgi:hypothetical protein